MAFGQGVIYAAGIDLNAKIALDSRLVCATTTERDAHITNNRAYEGMVVYCEDTGITYVLTDIDTPTWTPILTSNDIVNDLTTGGASKVLSAEQGKALQDEISQIQGGQLTVPVATDSKIGGVLSGGDITVAGNGAVTVNSADAADKLTTARTITLTGDASGSVDFDGSANVEIEVTVADDSHSHTIGNVDGLQDALDAKAPLASPALTGTPTAPTADTGTNTTQIATTAFVKAAIDAHIASAQALEFKGVATPETETPASPEVGDVYIVSEAGTVFGQTCEVGDMLIYSGTSWYVVQANIDGAVTGPTSSVSDNIAVFDGATGKIIKDGGTTIAALKAELTVGEATTSTAGLMSAEDKTKLDGIAEGAEVNQNAFSTIMAGETSVAASAKTDTVTIQGAGGLTVAADGKTITLTAPAAPGEATTSQAGLMSAADKTKLDSVAAGAEVNVQADWNQTTDTADDFIKNKPTALKNPNALSITAGSKSVTYDGSAEGSIAITSADVSAQPLISSGVAGNVAVVNDDGNATVDGGFSIPVPETGDTGKFVKATGEGTYGVATIEQSDVNGLPTALGGKVDKVTSATTGNLVEFGASGAVADSGVVADNVLQTTDYILLQCVIE